jgi:hypothetical protein
VKHIVIICLAFFNCTYLLAQSNASIYLKDGSNFDFEKAAGFTKDSLSLWFADKTMMRLSTDEIKKIILYHNYFNHNDTVKTIELNDGKKYAARNAVYFKNGIVHVLLIDDDEVIIPLHTIKSFTVHQEINKQDTNYHKKISFGVGCFFGTARDAPRGFQPELSVYFKVGSNLSLGVKAGQYFADKHKELISNTEIVKGTTLPKTANQANGNNVIASEKFNKTGGQNNINKNLIFAGVKAYYHLFGSKIENAAGLGLNCYFGGATSKLVAETDWMFINRTILLTDSTTGLLTNVAEPISAKVNSNTTFKRKTFFNMDWSYQIKYKLNKKIYLVNELGLLLGSASIIKSVEVNAEYKYNNGNVYNDESSFSKQFKSSQKANFEQVYLQVGLMF